jgi:hypothetical protein
MLLYCRLLTHIKSQDCLRPALKSVRNTFRCTKDGLRWSFELETW